MPDDLLNLLAGRERTRRVCRSAESAAVAGAAGCLAAAATTAAMNVQAASLSVALALAALPAVAGLALCFLPALRRRWKLTGPLPATLAVILIASGAIGVAVHLLVAQHAPGGTHALAGETDRLALTGPIVAASLLAGAVGPLLARADLSAAARLLDERGRFAERLATAAQLAAAGHAEPAAILVRRQACEILRSDRAARISLWTRTSATPAALAVSALLWCMLLLLPAAAIPVPPDLSAQLAALTPEQQEQLARQLRQAAADAAGKAPSPVALVAVKELPAALRAADAETFRRLLAELRAAGVDVDAALARQFHALADAASSPSSGRPAATPATLPGRLSPQPPPALASSGSVWVPPPNLRTVPVAAPPAGLDAAHSLSFDADWRAAVDSASAALESRSIPPHHQQLIRDFFAGQTAVTGSP